MLAALLIGSATWLPQDDVSERTYDLRALLGSTVMEEQTSPVVFPIAGGRHGGIYAEDVPSPGAPMIWSGSVGEETQWAVDPIELEFVLRAGVERPPACRLDSLAVFEESLTVTGDPVAHARVKRMIDALTRAARERVTVDTILVPRAAAPRERGVVLTPQEAADIFDAHPSAARIRGVARLGQSARLSTQEVRQYLESTGTELALYLYGIETDISWVLVGQSLGVWVDRSLRGDSFIVRTWGSRSEVVGEPRKLRLDGLAGMELEIPTAALSLHSASAEVDPGGALVVDAADGQVLVVRVTAPRARTWPDSPVVHLGELAMVPSICEPFGLPVVVPSRGVDGFDAYWFGDDHAWLMPPGGVEALVQSALELDRPPRTVRLGSRLLLPVEPSELARLRRAAVSRLLALETHTVEFTFAEFEARPRDIALALGSPGRLSELCEAAERTATGPAFGSDSLMLIGGLETSALSDHDTYVGNSMSPGNPQIRSLFDGSRYWCLPVDVARDRVTAWFDVRSQVGMEDRRTVTSFLRNPDSLEAAYALDSSPLDAGPATLDLELAATHPMGARSLVTMAANRWTLLSAQPRRGSATSTVIAVKARIQGR